MSGALFGDSFPPPGSGGSQDLTGTGDTTHYAMGTHFRVLTACTALAVRWFCPTGANPVNADFGAGLVQVDPTGGIGSPVAWLNWTTPITAPGVGQRGTWNTLTLSAPVALTVGQEVYAVVRTDRYGFSQHQFLLGDVAAVDSRLVMPVNSPNFPNGAFVTGGAESPNPPSWQGNAASFNENFYGVDVELAPPAGGGGSSERWGIPL